MEPYWMTIAESVKNWAETIAIVVGGGWAYWRFVIRRDRETALEIDLNYSTVPIDPGRFLVCFDVTFANKSSVKVTAKEARQPAYPDPRDETHWDKIETVFKRIFARQVKRKDSLERLNYGGSILLRRTPMALAVNSQLRWFANDEAKSPLPDDVQADLLDDYVLDGTTDFWLEPNETYHVGVGVALEPGLYQAMVTFVGNKRDDSEFWRRSFIVQIPKPGDVATLTANAGIEPNLAGNRS